MFGLFLFILFAPGVSEFLCASSDLEMSYTFCDSTAHIFMFNLTPCSTVNKSVWKAALTWVPKTLVSTFDIKGSRTRFPKGNYSVIVQGFSDDSEDNRLLCLNFTMIVKRDAF
uniref:Lymphocyte antigen 96 n=1 Tax=Zosterops lateralis melanops TaxID=1220523 RepID=A0A8D2PXB7_ZOSLA